MARQLTPGSISGVFVDVETGGLDPEVHGLTEVGMMAFTIHLRKASEDKPDFAIHGKFQTYVKPNYWMAYCPGALKMQSAPGKQVTLEFLEAHGREEIAVQGLIQQFLVDNIYPNEMYWNHQIWAQNADFDHGFLKALERRVSKQHSGQLRDPDPDTVRRLQADGLLPYGKIQPFSDRCDWSCTRKLFTKLGAMGIGEINAQHGNISLKHSMPYYGIDAPQTHGALEDCWYGIQVLAHMFQDEANYYRKLHANS